MMIGFCYWIMATGVSLYVLVWSIVVVVFIVIMLTLIYFGVRDKPFKERKIIRDRLHMEHDKRLH